MKPKRKDPVTTPQMRIFWDDSDNDRSARPCGPERLTDSAQVGSANAAAKANEGKKRGSARPRRRRESPRMVVGIENRSEESAEREF